MNPGFIVFSSVYIYTCWCVKLHGDSMVFGGISRGMCTSAFYVITKRYIEGI